MARKRGSTASRWTGSRQRPWAVAKGRSNSPSRSVTAVELAGVLDGEEVGHLVAIARQEFLHDGHEAMTADRLRALFVDDATRSRVSKLIRRTIRNIADSHRLLAQHLSGSISTGNACRYVPAGSRDVVWSLAPNDIA